MNTTALDAALTVCPIVAILRGIKPDEAIDVVEALYDAGIRVAEVPLNSPEPLVSIRQLSTHFGARMVIGAGTVISIAQAHDVADNGGQICVSPNMDPDVIQVALARGMVPLPGIATPTEAFAALKAGANILKLFPAGTMGPSFLKAIKAVLPSGVRILAVGGVSPSNFHDWQSAGAAGFGLGSELYKPGASPLQVHAQAQIAVEALQRRQESATLLCNPNATIGESPVFDPNSNSVLWVDPVQKLLFCYSLEESVVTQTQLEYPVSSLTRTAANDWFAIAGNRFFHFEPKAGQLTDLATCDQLGDGVNLTDMCVDQNGGIWASAFHAGALSGLGKIVYCDDQGKVTIVATGLGVPNGIGLTPSGTSLVVADTLHRTLLSFDISPAGLALKEPRILSDFMGVSGKPDGLAILPDGRIFVAMWGGACVAELSETGATLTCHPIAAPHVSSICALPDSDSAFAVSTSRMRLSSQQLAKQPSSGGLFRLDELKSRLQSFEKLNFHAN